MIKVPEKIWFVKYRDSNVAYLTYHEDSETAAYKKRKDTGLYWARFKTTGETGTVLENTPKQGFKIIGVSSRSRTDNKVFDILDTTQNIAFEISTYNLLTLIQECTIQNGIIVSDVVYYFDNGVGLMSVTGEAYQKYLKDKHQIDNKLSYRSLQLGDKFKLFKDKTEYVYCGRHKLKFNTHPICTPIRNYWDRSVRTPEVFPQTEVELDYFDYRLNLSNDRIELCKNSDKVVEVIGKTDYTPDMQVVLTMETTLDYDIKTKIRSKTAKLILRNNVDYDMKFEFLETTYKPNKE